MQSTTATRLVALRGKSPQSAVAKVAGVSPATVSNWENGLHSPPLEAAAKLARHYGVTTDYLAGLTDHPTALPPDSWVIDQDFVDALERRDGSHKALGKFGAFPVPRRPKIASSTEYRRLQEDLAKKGLVKPEESEEPKR